MSAITKSTIVQLLNLLYCTDLVTIRNVNKVGWLEVTGNAYHSRVSQPRIINNNTFNMSIMCQYPTPEQNTTHEIDHNV